MAHDPVTIGIKDDQQGDDLFTAFTKINANSAEVFAEIAVNTAAISANLALITGFTETYWFDANDTNTATTPITHTAGATNTYLTNNAAGTGTTSYNPNSHNALWDPVTNKFDFTSLKIGDTIEFRGDIEVNNSAKQEIDMLMSLAEGTATAFELRISHNYYKTAATGTPLTFMFRIYIGDENTRTGGARFRLKAIAATVIKVNGWFYQIAQV